MKYIVLLAITLPLAVSAQLSSENFQVDGYSVGSTQSTNASSENFETDQESGSLFAQEDEQQNERGSVAVGGAGGDQSTGLAATSSVYSIDQNASKIPADIDRSGSGNGDQFVDTLDSGQTIASSTEITDNNVEESLFIEEETEVGPAIKVLRMIQQKSEVLAYTDIFIILIAAFALFCLLLFLARRR